MMVEAEDADTRDYVSMSGAGKQKGYGDAAGVYVLSLLGQQ